MEQLRELQNNTLFKVVRTDVHERIWDKVRSFPVGAPVHLLGKSIKDNTKEQ